MTDDLIKRLRDYLADYDPHGKRLTKSVYPKDIEATAELIEQQAASLAAKDAEMERLKSAWKQQNDIIASQAKQIKDGRTIYDAALRRAEQAERALAEAVGVIRPFESAAHFYRDIPGVVKTNPTVELWQIPTSIEKSGLNVGHLRAARAFVAQHSDSRGEVRDERR